MPSNVLRSIAVFLNEAAPLQGAFAQAMAWAKHFSLPIRAIIPPRSVLSSSDNDLQHNRFLQRDVINSDSGSLGVVARCKEACQRQALSWELCLCEEPLLQSIKESFRTVGVFVYDDSLSPEVKKLAFQGIDRSHTSILYCPQAVDSASRILILNQPGEYSIYFLKSIARVCRAYQLTPFVLSIAQSETAALVSQSVAEEYLSSQGVPANFDFYVGDDVQNFISCVARLRRCSHILVEQKNHHAWMNGQKWNVMERMIALAKSCSLSCLVFPETTPSSILEAKYPNSRPQPSTRWPRRLAAR